MKKQWENYWKEHVQNSNSGEDENYSPIQSNINRISSIIYLSVHMTLAIPLLAACSVCRQPHPTKEQAFLQNPVVKAFKCAMQS